MKKSTELITLADYHDEINGRKVKTINPPVYHGSTVLFDSYEDLALANTKQYQGVTYGTNRLPNQRALEEALRQLEGGFLTRAFPSGINAIINTLLAFTRSGDHIILSESVYGPTARFCKKVLSKYDIEIEFLAGSLDASIARYIKANTKLIYLESPGSNTFEIHDVPAVAAVARERNLLTILDNTWATPLYLQPLRLGIDISIQSVTKYISGYSDVLLGAVTVNDKYAEEFKRFYRVMETFASPDDCHLALRGLKTLPVRLRQHEKSALIVAKWLASQPFIDQVLHPALPTHPQHHLWQRDFLGATGLFAFTFKEDYGAERLGRFINSLQLFGIGYSWGGYKSLITAGTYRRAAASPFAGKMIIRLSIGLEDPEDLIADLAQGFAFLWKK